MNYRFKIDTPWGKKGERVLEIITFGEGYRYPYWLIKPESYPQIFEPIEEKSDVEVLEEFWIKHSIEGKRFLILKKLLSLSAIDMAKIRKEMGE